MSNPTAARASFDQSRKILASLLDFSRRSPIGKAQPTSLRIGNAAIVFCLVYLWLRPVSNNFVLIPVLLGMGLASAAVCVVGAREFAPGFGPIWIGQLSFAVLGTTVAVFAGAPGILYGVLVYAAAPILFWTWVRALDLGTVRVALTWLAISTSALSTVIVIFVAGEKGLIPNVVPGAILDASGAGFGSSADITSQIRFYGLSTLAAAGPLWAASVFTRADKLMPPAMLRIYAASSATVAALVAGRRAIVVVTILAPLIAWACSTAIRWHRRSIESRDHVGTSVGAALRERRKMLIALGVLLVLGIAFAAAPSFFLFSAVSRSFVNAEALLTGGGAGVPDVRVAEAKALIVGWLQSPLVGHGFGAVLPNYFRDPARPWNFELQYHLILFQTGLLGLSLAILVLVFTLRQLRAAARAAPEFVGTLIVTTTGAVALLLANSVDPYLQAPGHMWAVYLPLAVANCMLLSQLKSTRASATSITAPEAPIS
jgi:hypothetical protein